MDNRRLLRYRGDLGNSGTSERVGEKKKNSSKKRDKNIRIRGFISEVLGKKFKKKNPFKIDLWEMGDVIQTPSIMNTFC